MAKTIGQIQALIDSQSLDARQLINLIADYLQANPGGGGVSIYTGDGALAGDRVVDLAGHVLSFINGNVGIGVDPTASYLLKVEFSSHELLQIGSDGKMSAIKSYNEDDGYSSQLTLSTAGGEGGVKFNLDITNGINNVQIVGDAEAATIQLTAANGIILPDLAGGDTTGLSIDNDGKIIRTP